MDTTSFEDGEVVGLDTDGCVVVYDAEIGRYNCGETPDEFGLNLMTPAELARIGQ